MQLNSAYISSVILLLLHAFPPLQSHLQVAALRAGQRALIHAGTGGVGLAALQYIQATGAIAAATAGSPWKRALLRSLGVRHVASSRDTGFASEIVAPMGGADVVLNSLTSPGMVAGSLALLGHAGTQKWTAWVY